MMIRISSTYNGIEDWVIDIGDPINHAGSFNYYLEYYPQGKAVRSPLRTFVVDPVLKCNGHVLQHGTIYCCVEKFIQMHS